MPASKTRRAQPARCRTKRKTTAGPARRRPPSRTTGTTKRPLPERRPHISWGHAERRQTRRWKLEPETSVTLPWSGRQLRAAVPQHPRPIQKGKRKPPGNAQRPPPGAATASGRGSRLLNREPPSVPEQGGAVERLIRVTAKRRPTRPETLNFQTATRHNANLSGVAARRP